ncbi:DUF726 domain-containing protein [uncultured Eudoraea sp.]|uniref:DUF726 domain-containing protein n=1 Tax=uncultured Eudoraea sp. TaxID=1035614 RepID=UPI00261316B5|nr:DUF726 domain-containing protein [uncultured Eudoraea sp.]
MKCRACDNFARWDTFAQLDDQGKKRRKYHHDQFCLEHRHEIPNFSTTKTKLKRPSDYKTIYKYNVRNLAKAGKVVLAGGAGMAVSGPLSFVFAPALGGAIGSLSGLSGAAATNYGLALLGFGSIAAGGMGMAGGMTVVTAAGLALGGSLGAYIGNSYMGDIYKFHIENVKNGKEPAVVTINGFLSEKDSKNVKGYQDWESTIETHFPDKEWYHVYWEAKKLYDLGSLVIGSGTSTGLSVIIGKAASHAAKQVSKKVAPVGSAMTAMQLSTNPWHVALVKAQKTGVLLADILKRTNKKYVILGHSLGCRVAYFTLLALATTVKKIIEDVHLTGGAVDREKVNWKIAKQSVSGKLFLTSSDTELGFIDIAPNKKDRTIIGSAFPTQTL